MEDRRRFLATATGLVGITGLQNHVLGQQVESEKPKPVDSKLVSQFVAKSHGDIETIKALLTKVPSLIHASWDWGDGDFESGLNAASHVGRRDIAEFLLERGARLDVAAAVMLGMTAIVREMIRVQPKLHAVLGAHNIPLLSHAILGNEKADEVFEMLLDSGADVNASSRIGMTPLMAAASVGRPEIVELLLDRGANADAKDSKGRTAIDVARKRKHSQVEKLLTAD